MDKEKLKELEKYLETTMRLARVYVVSLSDMKDKKEALSNDMESIYNISIAYCALYEQHTGINVWDLESTGFSEDIKEIAGYAKGLKDDKEKEDA